MKDKGMVSPFSQLSITPNPFEVVVANPSNLIVHFFLGSSATATFLGISSLNELFSFPGTGLVDLLCLDFSQPWGS